MIPISHRISMLAVQAHDRSKCAPVHAWVDCDTGDAFEAAVTKDGEWMVVTRVAHKRGEVIMFEIPREAFMACAQHMGLNT